VAALTAVALAFASAAFSAYWTAGGTALLGTVGGAIEELARDRTPVAVALGGVTVVAKLVAAFLVVALVRHPRRWMRVLCRLAGALLALWGAANVLLGGLVLTGVLDLGPIADERALRWHVLCWDLWFLVWGIALLVAVRTAGRGDRQRVVTRGGAVEPRRRSTGSTSSDRKGG
jgi:hypothetical protein